MTGSRRFSEYPEWQSWVTPKLARGQPVHRWCLFPHSFTRDLVHALIEEWELGPQDKIVDPFVGAGTTLLAAREKNISSSGYDLSPFAVFASNTKASVFFRPRLERTWSVLNAAIWRRRRASMVREYPELVRKALPDGRLEKFDLIAYQICRLECSSREKDFFRLALLSLIPRFSYAVASGGWLRWMNCSEEAEHIPNRFCERVEMMLSDINISEEGHGGYWKAQVADSRALPARDENRYSAVVTSPPYPNRHDYTRVFGIELMFHFLSAGGNQELRRQSFESHPESRPRRPRIGKYRAPKALELNIRDLEDGRIQRMLRGYFLDMHMCLREMARVCQQGARLAFVVGNARYSGRAILVDEFTAELGERAGLTCREIRVVRWRGNSSQQMGRYGRQASRESVVIFEKL